MSPPHSPASALAPPPPLLLLPLPPPEGLGGRLPPRAPSQVRSAGSDTVGHRRSYRWDPLTPRRHMMIHGWRAPADDVADVPAPLVALGADPAGLQVGQGIMRLLSACTQSYKGHGTLVHARTRSQKPCATATEVAAGCSPRVRHRGGHAAADRPHPAMHRATATAASKSFASVTIMLLYTPRVPLSRARLRGRVPKSGGVHHVRCCIHK